MASIPELEDAFVKAHQASMRTDATPEERELASSHAQAFATELKRQRGLTKTDENVHSTEFELASSNQPKNPTTLLDAGREILTQGGAGTAGQMIGSLAGPVGTVVGGAVGSGVGNVVNQLKRKADDPNYQFKVGELLADIGTGAIPGGPAAKGAGKVVREAVKQGTAGLVAGNAQKVIDEGRLQTGKENLFSTVIPAVAGGAAQKIFSGAPSTVLAAADAEAGRSLKSKTLNAGMDEGLRVIPSDVAPTTTTKQLESLAGKASLRQEVQLRNQEAVNKIVKKDLGIPENVDVTIPVLRGVRDEAGQVYNEIGQIASKAKQDIADFEKTHFTATDPHGLAIQKEDPANVAALEPLLVKAGADVEELKRLRGQSRLHRDRWMASEGALPDELAKSLDARSKAQDLEKTIEEAMRTAGKPELADKLKAARERIAKSYNAEDALNLGSGDFDPNSFGKQLNRGAPLSGGLETIAKFQQAFPKGMREASMVPAPGVGNLGFWARTVPAAMTLRSTGNPVLAAATQFAPSVAEEMARSRLLSTGFQRGAASALDPVVNAPEVLTSVASRLTGQAAGQNAATPPTATQSAVEYLREHPETAKDFDAKYGDGQAAKFLKRK